MSKNRNLVLIIIAGILAGGVYFFYTQKDTLKTAETKNNEAFADLTPEQLKAVNQYKKDARTILDTMKMYTTKKQRISSEIKNDLDHLNQLKEVMEFRMNVFR